MFFHLFFPDLCRAQLFFAMDTRILGYFTAPVHNAIRLHKKTRISVSKSVFCGCRKPKSSKKPAETHACIFTTWHTEACKRKEYTHEHLLKSCIE